MEWGRKRSVLRLLFMISCVFLAISAEAIERDQTSPTTGRYGTSTSSPNKVPTSPSPSNDMTKKSTSESPSNKVPTEKMTTTSSSVMSTSSLATEHVKTASHTGTSQDQTSTTSSSPHSPASSTSTPLYDTFRTVLISHHEHIGKRSAEELPDSACNSEGDVPNLQQGNSYEIYDIEMTHDHFDEKGKLQLDCQLKKEYKENCKSWVKLTVQNISLMVNGTRRDEEYVKEHDSEKNVMKFVGILHYESHNGAQFTCVNSLTTGAKLVSLNKTLRRVDELHNYTISPQKSLVTIGESFALTCKTDSIRALKVLRWEMRKTEDGLNVMIERDKTTVAGLNYNVHESVKDLHSVINFTTDDDGRFKSRIDYTFFCTETFIYHPKQDIGEAKVGLLPVDYSLRDGGIAAGVVILLLTVGLTVFFLWRRKKLRSSLAVSIRMVETRNAIMAARQTSNDYDGDRVAADAFLLAMETVNSIMDRIKKKHSAWEKDKSKIQIKQTLGEGNFGLVLLGQMPNEFGIIQPVAIKTIKEQGIEVSALLDFEKEMEVMVTLKHRNIVNLLGICALTLPFYIIMEYMENGQLNSYLNQFAPSREEPLGGLSVGQLAWMCQQPCDALEYLATNNMVHRDVSARNCLVGKNLQVKLADFGLSRDTSANDKNYYKKEGGMVPIKWMAPEALTYGRYTTANDVWAFGILAWEVFSFGALPYQHLTNQQVMVNICKGERLDRPHLCPDGLWEVLLKCWADTPDERIQFQALLAFFKEYSEETSEFTEQRTEFSIQNSQTSVEY